MFSSDWSIRALTSLIFILQWAIAADLGFAAESANARWEADILAFEKADRTNPPPANGVLFIGSSSIRLWKTLTSDFPGVPVINRGFGGSEMADSVQFADRIVLPYKPRHILVYAGDNDIANGKSPERILADFKAFVEKVHQRLPETRISYIAIKPSPSRWHLAEKARTANRMIAAYTQTNPRLGFIDVFTAMLGPDGKPREDLFVADKLHLNQKGYELWRSLVRPHLAANQRAPGGTSNGTEKPERP